MTTHNQLTLEPQRRWPRTLARFGLIALWECFRLPALAVLAVMEPIVTALFSGLSVLSLLVALFFGLVVKPPHFPFWPMLAFSATCALVLLPYYLLMRLLSGRVHQ